jgi:predicted HTH domain antitoxin
VTKTMSIRMDQENYAFLTALSAEDRSDLSKSVRELVTRGRILLAVEKYKSGAASLGKAAEVAGMPIGQMMTVLEELGVRSNIDLDDYRQGLANLAELD